MVALSRPQHKLKQHKGWTHKSSPRKREYIKTWVGFSDPAGNEVAPIRMFNLISGVRKRHKGWTWRAKDES